MRPVPLSLYCTHLSALPSPCLPFSLPGPPWYPGSSVSVRPPAPTASGLAWVVFVAHRSSQLTRGSKRRTHAQLAAIQPTLRQRLASQHTLTAARALSNRRFSLVRQHIPVVVFICRRSPPLSLAAQSPSPAAASAFLRVSPSSLSLFFSSPSFPPASKSSGLHHPEIFLSLLSRCLLILCWSTAHPLPSGPCSLKLGSGVIS